jgi:hypothetical protein
MVGDDLDPRLARAIWEGDVDLLNEIAGCICCCGEHTFTGCPARQWGGCRGQGVDPEDHKAWFEHYRRFHGMTEAQFYGFEERTP